MWSEVKKEKDKRNPLVGVTETYTTHKGPLHFTSVYEEEILGGGAQSVKQTRLKLQREHNPGTRNPDAVG